MYEGTQRIHGREDPDHVIALDDDGAAVLVVHHDAGHVLERRIGRYNEYVGRHRLFDGDTGRVDVAQRLDQERVALGEDPSELATLEHGKVPDAVAPHALVRERERLIAPDRMGCGCHELPDQVPRMRRVAGSLVHAQGLKQGRGHAQPARASKALRRHGCCTSTDSMKRIVITGGPGAGKTASLETARRSLCEHVGFARESATIVFGGGFPRELREHAECAAQRAIFHVQRELETVFDDREDLALLVCDRGTVDCAAYWPRPEADFYRELGTTKAEELARYDAVIHLRPPPDGDGYQRVGLRVESASEAARIDARIERSWRGHPRRIFIDHTHDFPAKVGRVLRVIEAELQCTHPLRAA